MRKLFISATVAIAALVAAPALAADMPEYPDVELIPPVDYDIGGSFYLRGSAALNLHWAGEVRHDEAWAGEVVHPIVRLGYGYSWGVGFGYETGTGLRFDGTIDMLETKGIGITKDFANGEDVDGDYTLMLRSTIALANAYYDFDLSGFGGGGTFAYVGAGAGVAFNHAEVNAPDTGYVPTGGNVSAAAAVMAGVGYDMGTWVADLGYRGIYINAINNWPTDPATDPGLWYQIDHSYIHELRGTVRYRFN